MRCTGLFLLVSLAMVSHNCYNVGEIGGGLSQSDNRRTISSEAHPTDAGCTAAQAQNNPHKVEECGEQRCTDDASEGVYVWEAPYKVDCPLQGQVCGDDFKCTGAACPDGLEPCPAGQTYSLVSGTECTVNWCITANNGARCFGQSTQNISDPCRDGGNDPGAWCTNSGNCCNKDNDYCSTPEAPQISRCEPCEADMVLGQDRCSRRVCSADGCLHQTPQKYDPGPCSHPSKCNATTGNCEDDDPPPPETGCTPDCAGRTCGAPSRNSCGICTKENSDCTEPAPECSCDGVSACNYNACNQRCNKPPQGCCGNTPCEEEPPPPPPPPAGCTDTISTCDCSSPGQEVCGTHKSTGAAAPLRCVNGSWSAIALCSATQCVCEPGGPTACFCK